MIKEAAEGIGNILGNVSLLLVVTIGSALLLYFPPHLVPDGAQATVVQYRGWIWGAMILGVTGLLVRVTTSLTTKVAAWSRSAGAGTGHPAGHREVDPDHARRCGRV